jgi:hypothetical protein
MSWEVNVDEKRAEVISPVVVMHEEGSVISSKIELLIHIQGLDILLDAVLVLLHFLTVVRPGTIPLTFTPRVSQSHESEWLLSIILVLYLDNVTDAVGVVQNQTRWLSIDNKGSFFTVPLDAATHEAAIFISAVKELPETFFRAKSAAVVLDDHLVREHTCLLVSDEDLLWLHACQLLNTFVNIS